MRISKNRTHRRTPRRAAIERYQFICGGDDKQKCHYINKLPRSSILMQ